MRNGMLVPDGEHATLEFRRTYPHRIADVWDAISTPEGLRGWLMATGVVVEPRPGGRIEMVSGPSRFLSRGTILAWEPPRVLEYEWNVAPVPEMPHGERAIVRYALEERGGETHLLVTYRRITLHTARGFLPGLHVLLDRLEAQLAGRAMPGFVERFAEVSAGYPQWTHAAAPGK